MGSNVSVKFNPAMSLFSLNVWVKGSTQQSGLKPFNSAAGSNQPNERSDSDAAVWSKCGCFLAERFFKM